MIGQSLGSILVVMECLLRFIPDQFWDTTGAAFSFPIVALITGCEIATYVHYPTISMVHYCGLNMTDAHSAVAGYDKQSNRTKTSLQ